MENHTIVSVKFRIHTHSRYLQNNCSIHARTSLNHLILLHYYVHQLTYFRDNNLNRNIFFFIWEPIHSVHRLLSYNVNFVTMDCDVIAMLLLSLLSLGVAFFHKKA